MQRQRFEVKLDIAAADKEVNAIERNIRKKLLTHLALGGGTTDLSAAFNLVSVTKGIHDLARHHPGRLHGGSLEPRLAFLHEQFIYRRLAGAMIALAGLCLLLPLPVPFSNGLPAWTILLLAAAALERDGLCFLAGGLLFLATATFFALLAFGRAQAIQRFWPFGGTG